MDVKAFIESGKPIQLSREVSGPLCIVDSSFNPPHFAHLQLARLGLDNVDSSTVVLMLATGNADKPAAPIADLERRVAMMELLAHEIDTIGHRVVLALVNKPYFIDKARVLRETIPASPLIFVVGFDTLVRFLDQKYYTEPVDQVTDKFFAIARLLVLSRVPDPLSNPSSVTPESQLQYNRPGVVIIEADSTTENVSSSRARKAIEQGDSETLAKVVPQSIIDYIHRERLYNSK